MFLKYCNATDPEVEAINYLKKFGYLADRVSFSLTSVSDALKKFQEFTGLVATGELDEDTVKLMSLPRCGFSDLASESQVEESVWKKRNLSYRVTQYSRKMKRVLVNDDVEKAFKFWSDVTNIQFYSKEDGNVDIEIGFFTFDHGDGDPFTGVGGTLAHAYPPQYGGDVHVDDSEIWTQNSEKGSNLLQILTHEIGHSLGLDHSGVTAAVMAPIYRGWDPGFKLHPDDIHKIQSLYGRPTSTPSQPFVFPTTLRKPKTTKRLGCPDMNRNTIGRSVVERLNDIKSWSACASRCSKKKQCKYWTWHSQKTVNSELQCFLMSDFVFTAEDSTTISGSSGCTQSLICKYLSLKCV